ncbi:Protein kinase protein rad53 [Clarireedia jacksonii]
MSDLRDLSDWKLEALFETNPRYVVHTSYQADWARGVRRVPIVRRWSPQSPLLGAGVCGSVRLEKEIGGAHSSRAVKRFEDDDTIYLAMKYFPLGTLIQFINEDLTEDDARTVAFQLAEGLRIMHEENFTHRDLKPQNIFVAQRFPN